ncbi:integral membrane HPP family protein [Actinidia rufa]|uniref:Integral membrane HPP family protein n=1 Tax=Actinidia rufa TaxID=165716 RepID=A0A7J0FY63_9ERIC|nr:integral membrane HPP family protein [Actinidia rufa]
MGLMQLRTIYNPNLFLNPSLSSSFYATSSPISHPHCSSPIDRRVKRRGEIGSRSRERVIIVASSNVAEPISWDEWKPEKGSQAPPLSDVFWPAAGAFAAMAVLGKMDQLLAPKGVSMTIAPFGAVCAVLFATPSSPAARSSAGLVRLDFLSLLCFMSPPHTRKRPRTRGGSSDPSTPRPQRDHSDGTSDTHKFRPSSEAEARFNRYFHSRPIFIHRGVLLHEFPDTVMYTYFHHMGWERMAIPEGFACPKLVREFYINIHGTDKEVGTLKTYVRGTFLNFSIIDICVTLLIPPLHPDRVGFPYPPSVTPPSKDSLAHLLLASEGNWPSGYLLKKKDLKDVFRVLNHVICNLFQYTSHVSEIDEVRARFMHAIATNLPINLGRQMFNLILTSSLENTACGFLPFGLLITSFLEAHQIVPESHDTHLPPSKPISRWTLLLSNAHLGVTPPPPRLRPHTVEIVPSDDEITPSHGDPSPSTTLPAAPPAVSDSALKVAIASLIAHMDKIHKDLIERIGLVHERVDRIAESPCLILKPTEMVNRGYELDLLNHQIKELIECDCKSLVTKYNVFIAQIGCAAFGVLAFSIFGPGWLARSTGLAAAIAFMIYTRSVHPPARGGMLLEGQLQILNHQSSPTIEARSQL